MVRDGRSTKSLIGRNAADVQIVGYADLEGVLTGMADAVTAAIGDGVPVRMLPGHDVFGTGAFSVAVDVRSEQLRTLEASIASARKEADAATNLAVEHGSIGNDLMRDRYNEAATRRSADLQRLQQAYEQLAAEPVEAAADKPFDVRADIWVKAIHRLKTCGGRLTQEEKVAFQAIVPDFRMELIDDMWWGVATIRLNTLDGVAELGPIKWKVSAPGRSTRFALNSKAAATGETRTRQGVLVDLLATGRITKHAAQVVCNAPLPQLRQVLLHELCGEPWPDWVGDQWREPAFVNWIVNVYTTQDWHWAKNGKFGSTLLYRQYAVWILAGAGPLTWNELQARMRNRGIPASQFCRPHADKNVDARATQPSLKYTGQFAPTGEQLISCIECECGQLATIVARAPEVLSDLLCDCGRAPGGTALGMPEDLRFPEEYRQMRIDLETCERDVKDRFERFKTNLTKREILILQHAHLLAGGASAHALGKALERGDLSIPLHKLADRGLAEVHGKQWKRKWFLTTDGKAQAARLAPVHGEPEG